MPKLNFGSRNLRGMRSFVEDYVPAAATLTSGWTPGAFVQLNAAGEALILGAANADPTPLLGTTLNSRHEDDPTRDRVLVEHFDPDTVFTMNCSRAPLATDIGLNYGLIWSTPLAAFVVDFGDVAATRVHIVDVDPAQLIAFVVVLEAHRQSPVDI